MSIFAKLMLSFGLVIITSIGIAFNAGYTISNTEDLINDIYNKPLKSIDLSRKAETSFANTEVSLRQILFLQSSLKNPETFQDKVDEMKNEVQDVENILDELEKIIVSPTSISYIKEIQDSIKIYAKFAEEITKNNVNINDIDTQSKIVKEKFSLLFVEEQQGRKNFKEHVNQFIDQSKFKNILFTTIISILSLIIAIILTRTFVKPIKLCVALSKEIARGNLNNQIDTNRKDEFGELLKSFSLMQTDLFTNFEKERQQIIEKENIEKEAHRKDLIDSLTDKINENMITSINNIEKSTRSIKEMAQDMNVFAQDSATQSQNSAKLINSVNDSSNTVAAAAEELSASIKDISQQTSRSNEIAKIATEKAEVAHKIVITLTEAASKIGNIVEVINGITEQINLLALNATIESSRAGEAGKGFAVVASEVKNLAGQTTRATENIVTQITSMQDVVLQAEKIMNEIVSTISNMTNISTAIDDSMDAQNIATNEISHNILKVSNEIGQVSKNIVHLAETSNDTQKYSNNLLTSLSELSEQSVKMNELAEILIEELPKSIEK